MARSMMVALACGALGAIGSATAAGPAAAANTAQSQVCKMVVSAEIGSKPYQMCLTKAEWKARQDAEKKDANRMVCRYQEQPGTRFRSYKICLPQAEWDNQRLRERQAIEQIQMRSCVPGAGC